MPIFLPAITVPTPVIITTWLDPPLQSDWQLGASVTWHADIVDRISRVLVDPDVVSFSYTNPPVTSTAVGVSYTKETVGRYRVDLPFNAPGSWLLKVATTSSGGTATGNASLVAHVFAA
jgi:hypothetical protein